MAESAAEPPTWPRPIGRPLNPVRQDHPLLARFCEELRQLYLEAGSPKFETMAARAKVATSTISRAASGRFPPPPSWSSIAAWIRGCGHDPAPWRARYDELIAALKADGRPGSLPRNEPGHEAVEGDEAIEGGEAETNNREDLPSTDPDAQGSTTGPGHLAPGRPAYEAKHPGPSHSDLVADLRQLREKGLIRARRLQLPALELVAGAGLVETVLREAVDAMGPGEAGTATAYLFGLVQGTIGRRPTDLRERAAREYRGMSPETFRKDAERLLIDRVADELLIIWRRRDASGPASS